MVNYVAGHFALGPFGVLTRMKLTREFSLHCLLVQKKRLGSSYDNLGGNVDTSA